MTIEASVGQVIEALVEQVVQATKDPSEVKPVQIANPDLEKITASLAPISKLEFTKARKENIYGISCEWSPCGRYLLTNSADNKARVFVLSDYNELTLKTAVPRPTRIDCVRWNHDGTLFATTCQDLPVQIWDLEGKIRATVGLPEERSAEIRRAFSLAFSQDGLWLFVGYKSRIRWYDARNFSFEADNELYHKKKDESVGPHGLISCLAVNPRDPQQIAIGGYDNIIRLHHLNPPVRTIQLLEVPGPATHLEFSQDGWKLFVGTRKADWIVCFDLFDLNNPLIKWFRRPVWNQQTISFKIDRTNKYIISGSSSGDVLVYEIDTEGTIERPEADGLASIPRVEPKFRCKASLGTVCGLSLHPTRALMATIHGERIIRGPLFSDSEDENLDESMEESYNRGHLGIDNGVKLWAL
ncbi:hypothetical protein L596_010598 [Steinernema carpocapsae]|uniref:WD repeat-containing protein 79 n=1 Tax=Steinernema carpocapsae TaxID=34508 RepID=A0A4U5PIY3_STECR|nr:hypothetical protein L596_010598 [Steinernema carpocapsae]